MDIFAHLKQDHDKVKKIMNQIEETTERAEKTRTELFELFKSSMLSHSKAEEETFYAALKDQDETRDLVLEAIEEHAVVEKLIFELTELPVSDETWTAKFSVLKENVEHHIKEEENELFKKARNIFSKGQPQEIEQEFSELEEEYKNAM
jgi:hemerythrin-like domain-containing protein